MSDVNNALPNKKALTEPAVVIYQPTSDTHLSGPSTNEELVDPGPQPLLVECPLCHQKVRTVIKYMNTTRTHLLACCICMLGGVFCAVIPYFLKAYNRIEHYCPGCNNCVGYYVK